MESQKLLESLGLSRAEAEVYVALLRSGKSTASKIIQHTRMHRPDVYDTLERLVDNGLASRVMENKVRHYSTGISALSSMISKEERILEAKKLLLEQNLGELSSMESTIAKENEAEIFRGLSGLARMWNPIISSMTKKDVLYGYGRPGFSGPRAELYNKTVLNFHAKRSEIGMPFYTIYPPSKRAEITRRRGYPPVKIRYSSKEFDIPGYVHIFRNNVVLWDTSEPEITMFVIRNDMVAKTMLAYFWLLWKQAKTKLR